MSKEPTRVPQELTTADLVDRLSRFKGPPKQFLLHLLAVQCHVAAARAGAILRIDAEGHVEILAVYPQVPKDAAIPVWLAQAVESAPPISSAGKTVVKPLHGSDDLYGQPAEQHLIMIPLHSGADIRGLTAFLIETQDPNVLTASRERLELTISLLSLYEMRLALERRQMDLERMRVAMETLSAVNGHARFAGSAMAMCNEVASRWQCERVGIGFLKGRYVNLRAMSHTEKFTRKMKLVQDIEAAMEECLDQDVEVVYPSAPDAVYVSRAAGELSGRHGPTAIISLPLRQAGEPVAVLTAERAADRPFALEEVESLRLTCDLCTARLVDLNERDRWVGAKAAAGIRKGLGKLVGAEHTWLKVVAVLVLAFVLFLIFAKGQYRVEAPFVLQAAQQQVVPAPFDGFLKTVSVEPGDPVEAGKTVLATLETAELRLQLAAVKAEQMAYAKQADAARRDGKTAEAQIAQAQADRVAAQIRLLDERVNQATIISPIDGYVLTGDLKQRVGAPVEMGEVLFEVAPIEALRAEISVPEDQIADVKEDQEGYLATASNPSERIQFKVERIEPVAEVVSQRNVFKVRVRLVSPAEGLRPGTEGVAKISIDRRRYGWIWTRSFVNWLRMKLWL